MLCINLDRLSCFATAIVLVLLVHGQGCAQYNQNDGYVWVEAVDGVTGQPVRAEAFVRRLPAGTGPTHRGTTPWRVRLTPGQYRLAVEAASYQVTEPLTVHINPNLVERRTVTLYKNPVVQVVALDERSGQVLKNPAAFIDVKSTDGGTDIRGRPVPANGLEVPPGHITVRVHQEFYGSGSTSVFLPPGPYNGVQTIEVQLKRYPAAVTVVTDPDGAEVQLMDLTGTGRHPFTGKTPVTFSSKPARGQVEIPGAGYYRLTVTHLPSSGDKVVFTGDIRLEPVYTETAFQPRLVYLDIYDYVKTFGSADTIKVFGGSGSPATPLRSPASQNSASRILKSSPVPRSDALRTATADPLIARVVQAIGMCPIVDVGGVHGLRQGTQLDVYLLSPGNRQTRPLGRFKVRRCTDHLALLVPLSPVEQSTLKKGNHVLLVTPPPEERPEGPRTMLIHAAW